MNNRRRSSPLWILNSRSEARPGQFSARISMIAVDLFGLAVVREVFPEARDQRHVPEAVGRRLSCLLRAHQIDRPGLAPGVLHLETGARSGHHVVSWGGRRRVVPKRCHRNTVVTRRALLLALLYVRILLEAHPWISRRFGIVRQIN